MNNNDLIMAFFPCIRFEAQILLHFRGDSRQQKNQTLLQKLETDIKLHSELHHNYCLITKLACVAIKKQLRLIIENPYCEQSYLTRYWCVKPAIIDKDRSRRGDYYKKPTQYFFINIEPTNNIIMDYMEETPEQKKIASTADKVERSMISKEYAIRFIREFIGIEQLN